MTEQAVQHLLAHHENGFGAFTAELLDHVRAVASAERVLADSRDVRPTHGDFWDGNVLLQDGAVAAVLDFGFLAERPRVDDLALPIWFWMLEPGHGLPTAEDGEVVARLADAYDAGADVPLSAGERASLPLAVARQPAWAARQWLVDPRPGVTPTHARKAAAELPVARAVLALVDAWQAALRGPRS